MKFPGIFQVKLSTGALELNYRQCIGFLTQQPLGECQVFVMQRAEQNLWPELPSLLAREGKSDTCRAPRPTETVGQREEAWRGGDPTHALAGPASPHNAALILLMATASDTMKLLTCGGVCKNFSTTKTAERNGPCLSSACPVCTLREGTGSRQNAL